MDIKTYQRIKSKRFELRIDFIKHILTVSSGVLAVLVSLNRPYVHNSLFFCLLVLFLASALFGTIALIVVIYDFRKMDIDAYEQLTKEFWVQRNPKWISAILRFFEIGTYAFFVLGLICMIVYIVS